MNEYSEKPGLSSRHDHDADGERPASLKERVRSLRLPDRSAAPRSGRPWLPWALCLLFAASTLYLYYGPSRQPTAPDPSATEPEKPDATAPASAPAPTGNVVLESKGYIIPVHQIQVSPKVSGMITKLMIEEGMRVAQGQILAQLETVDYQADYDHAVAVLASNREKLRELENGNRPEEIEQAKAELEEADAQLKQLHLDYLRTNRLQTGQAMAPRDFEQSWSSYKAMERRVEKLRQAYRLMIEGPRDERIAAARADVKQADADAAKAKWRLDNCTIRAPISGTILTKKAEEGNIVNPIAFNISASLCDMADLSDLEVDLTIQERDVAKVFKGQKCKVRPEAFPDRLYEGAVSRLMPIADRAKGAVPVRVKVQVPKDEEGVYLKPDMGVLVSFLKGEK